MYDGVPITSPACVSPLSLSSCRARPKSVILGVPSAASKTLAGFKSRCATLRLCASCIAHASVSTSLAASRAAIGLPPSWPARLPPSTNSSAVGMAAGLADLVNLHDVRMLQPRHRLRFDAEAGQLARFGVAAGQHHLERDGAFQGQLMGLVHDSHAAATENGFNVVTGDGQGRRPGRRGRGAISRLPLLALERGGGIVGGRRGRLPDLRGGPGVGRDGFGGSPRPRSRGAVGGPQRVVGVGRRHRSPFFDPLGIAGGVRPLCDRSVRQEVWRETMHYPRSCRECQHFPENPGAPLEVRNRVAPLPLLAPRSQAGSILHAARSETSSNSWKLRVMRVASLSA